MVVAAFNPYSSPGCIHNPVKTAYAHADIVLKMASFGI
jgi:hypothetical protein